MEAAEGETGFTAKERRATTRAREATSLTGAAAGGLGRDTCDGDAAEAR